MAQYKMVMKYWRTATDRENGIAQELVITGLGVSLALAADLMGSGMQVSAGLVHIRICRVQLEGVLEDCTVIFESPDCRNLGRKVDAMLKVIYHSA